MSLLQSGMVIESIWESGQGINVFFAAAKHMAKHTTCE